MVEKLKLNVRVSRLHRDWLGELCDAWGMNEGDAVQILIDRAYHEYKRAQGLTIYNTPAPTDEGPAA